VLDSVVNAAVSGLIIGSLYAIMAIGLTVIYGVSHVFNFAHGHVAVIGAYVTWLLFSVVGIGLWLGIGVALVFMVAFGWLMYQFTIRYLLRRKGWEFATLLFTLGFAILLEFGLLELFGPRIKSLPVFFRGQLNLGFGTVGWHEVALIGSSIGILLLLAMFLKRTTLGQAMRAVSQSMPGARIVGIDTDRVFGYTFALAFVLTGVSGVLLGTKVFMNPHIGWEWMIKGFIIVTFGGLGNPFGAALAAFALGVIEAEVTLFAGDLWIWPAWLLTFILTLSLRPQGLLGSRT
jgi:branched-chain amino acid transport system permease protein